MRYHIKDTLMPILGALAVLTLTLILVLENRFVADPLRPIGVIMLGGQYESGWDGAHFQGIKVAATELSVPIIVKSHVPESIDPLFKAVDELAAAGCQSIILTSYGYANMLDTKIAQYPNIMFFSTDENVQRDNVKFYMMRMYQPRYLSGILAGLKTNTGTLGFVADRPTHEVVRGINAFALGARSVNPKARVLVNWTGHWMDVQAEEKATRELMTAGADVITSHQGHFTVTAVASDSGVYTIAYNEAPDYDSLAVLGTVGGRWEQIYRYVIRNSLKRNFEKQRWIGLESGAVYFGDFSPAVTDSERAIIQEAEQRILGGQAVFSGFIRDNKGVVRCLEGEAIPDTTLLKSMNWFVEGVKIYGE